MSTTAKSNAKSTTRRKPANYGGVDDFSVIDDSDDLPF